MMTLAAPWISDRGGFERPSRAAALVSALTWPLPPRLAGSREIKLGLVCCPPPRSLLVTHSLAISPLPMPLFCPIVLSLSLSLSLSLRPPRILFPAVCPFRLSLHILALRSPELCRIISHSPPPQCPLSAYPPRPNSCGPDIVFGAPTPPLLSWTQQFDFLDPNNFTPRLPPLICPT